MQKYKYSVWVVLCLRARDMKMLAETMITPYQQQQLNPLQMPNY